MDRVERYAWWVTWFKRKRAARPKSCPAVNCIRPLNLNASMEGSKLLWRISFTILARSSLRDGVLSISTSPRCNFATLIVTPNALVEESKSGAFEPDSANDQPRSFNSPWITAVKCFDSDLRATERCWAKINQMLWATLRISRSQVGANILKMHARPVSAFLTAMCANRRAPSTSTLWGLGDSVTWTAKLTDDLVKSSTHRVFGPWTTPGDD